MARKSTSDHSPRRFPADSKFLKKARERFKAADEADNEQGKRERTAIQFEAEGSVSGIKEARKAVDATGTTPAMPERPWIVVNQIKPRVRKIVNQERASDIGIELVPADDFGDLGIVPDDTEVTLREGLIRRIQRESKAADARSWAFKRALIAGRGYYLVMTRYLPGKTYNQEIYVERIYNQAGVLLDPSHESPDGSDAEFAFVGTWMPWDRYKAQYQNLDDGKENPASAFTNADFTAMAEEYPGWYETESDKKAIRVVDYWYKERTFRSLAIMDDGRVMWADEVPEGQKPADTRQVEEVSIKFCKIGGGIQELEKTDWAGPDMPIIKVIGEEILPYDNERRYEGMVTPAMGSQMALNYMISKQVEVVGQAPIPALMVDPDAIEGYEGWYAVANTRPLPYLPHRSFDDQGRPLREPHRPSVDPNILPIAQSVGLFNQAIQDTTDVQDPAMGKTDSSVKSARHAETLIAETNQGTSNWMDNLKRSLEYEAQVENNLLYPIYGANPGRLVRVLTGEGESQMMRIGDPEQAQQQEALQKKAEKVGKLTKDAHFNVIVKIANSTENRRNQFVRMFGEILSAAPEQMGVGGDLFYQNMDMPESKQLAKRQKVMLHPQVQALIASEAEGAEAISPVAQSQLAKMAEQIKAAEVALAEATEMAKGKQLETDAKLHIAQMQVDLDFRKEELRAKTDLEKAREDNATKIHIAQIAARTKGVQMAGEAEAEAIALDHEATLKAADLAHDEIENEKDRVAEILAAPPSNGAVDQGDRMEAGA